MDKKNSAIHILIVSSGRPQLLARCLESIWREFHSISLLQIHILINGKDTVSENLVQEFTLGRQIENLHLKKTENRLPPGEARNLLLKNISLGWVGFIDDDAFLPENYVVNFLRVRATEPWAQIIGGPNLNAASENAFAEACSHALASPWGSGPFWRRYAKGKPREVHNDLDFILCHLWLYLEQPVTFQNAILAGEENLLIWQLLSEKKRALYTSDLYVHHERRTTWASFCAQLLKYGRGRAEIFKKTHRSSWILLAPLAAIMLTLVWPLFFYIYLSLNFFASLVTGYKNKSWSALPTIFGIFFCIHLFYTLGIILEFLKINFQKQNDI